MSSSLPFFLGSGDSSSISSTSTSSSSASFFFGGGGGGGTVGFEPTGLGRRDVSGLAAGTGGGAVLRTLAASSRPRTIPGDITGASTLTTLAAGTIEGGGAIEGATLVGATRSEPPGSRWGMFMGPRDRKSVV